MTHASLSWRLASWLVVALLLGCQSRTATIVRTNGAEYEGRIVGRQGDHLLIEQGPERKPGSVPLDEVADVDHPGNVDIIVGSSLAAVGLWPTIAGLVLLLADDVVDEETGTSTNADELGGTIGLGIGLAMIGAGAYLAISGGLEWSRSRRAFDTVLPAPGAQVHVAPWGGFDPNGDPRGGLGVRVVY